jgi:hypothetical protein
MAEIRRSSFIYKQKPLRKSGTDFPLVTLISQSYLLRKISIILPPIDIDFGVRISNNQGHLRAFSRHSSVVEQLIRNQQVEGSNPPAGSNDFKALADMANPSFFTCDFFPGNPARCAHR